MNDFRVMILEDDPQRIRMFKSILELQAQNVDYYTTAHEFIEATQTETHVDLMLLDHDLGNRVYVSEDEENTGSEVVRHILKNVDKFKETKFIIHSFNNVAAKSMYDNLRTFSSNVAYVPGIWNKEVFRSFINFNI